MKYLNIVWTLISHNLLRAKSLTSSVIDGYILVRNIRSLVTIWQVKGDSAKFELVALDKRMNTLIAVLERDAFTLDHKAIDTARTLRELIRDPHNDGRSIQSTLKVLSQCGYFTQWQTSVLEGCLLPGDNHGKPPVVTVGDVLLT